MRDKFKAIWRILKSEYFILLTYDEDKNYVDVKLHYKKHHKEDKAIVNDIIETIWRYMYFGKQNEN